MTSLSRRYISPTLCVGLKVASLDGVIVGAKLSSNPRVVIKLGGGLITDKSQLCNPNNGAIAEVCSAISEIIKQGVQPIVVHGAGSFGHLRAKAWQLHLGRNDNVSPIDNLTSQDEAIAAVRNDMSDLNSLLVEELNSLGIATRVYPPREWANGYGHDFIGDVSVFSSVIDGVVPITFGDVVDCPPPEDFGVLSGDDLVYRIGTEIPNVERVIFAMGDVDGLLSEPPNSRDSRLLETWSTNDTFSGTHIADKDVTGGIFLKSERGAQILSKGVAVIFIRGLKDRIVAAALGQPCIGTILVN